VSDSLALGRGDARFRLRGRGVAACALIAGLAFALGVAAAPAPKPPPKATSGAPRRAATSAKRRPTKAAIRSVLDLARETRELEDMAAYARALQGLRALRPRVIGDADLELALALDEARAGLLDSARTRLRAPLMLDAVKDTLPIARRREYPYRREGAWLNGHYDGWPWYIWRARAELGAATGNWGEAYEAAREGANARPLSGKDWLVLAVCAARTQHDDESRRAAARAIELDPTLPEAHHLAGLWEWKAGRRSEAQAAFRRAVKLDSAYVPAALSMMRSRIPGIAPDSLPTELLTGPRRAGLLTAPEGPKPEEFVQVDVSAMIESSPDTAVADSIPPGVKPLQLVLSLLIDERGRPILNDLPWFAPGAIPNWKITRLLTSVPSWRFTPAIKLGSPHAVWVSLDFYLTP